MQLRLGRRTVQCSLNLSTNIILQKEAYLNAIQACVFREDHVLYALALHKWTRVFFLQGTTRDESRFRRARRGIDGRIEGQ